jgi:hypothetical protein
MTKQIIVTPIVQTTEHDIHAWPYAAMRKNYDAGNSQWTETDNEVFHNQLGCVPPARHVSNGFAVGECYMHDKKYNPIHAVFMCVKGRYFCRLDNIRKFDADAYRQEIINQFLDL